MLELEQHLKEVVTQILNIFLLKVASLVIDLLRKVRPFQQVLKGFTVLFDCKPDTNENQILIVFKLGITASLNI